LNENLSDFKLNKMMGFYVNRTAFLMSEEISKRFNNQGFNITAQDFGILNLLWTNDKQTHASISKEMMRDKTTITRRIDSLEKKGYLTREIDNIDRRVIRVCLTKEGFSIKDNLISILLDFHQNLLSDIPSSDLEITKKTLEKIILKQINYIQK